MVKPVIAIVGRANVGKSTLFNRLTGRMVAIVEDLPGTTRDRIFADVHWLGREVTLVDTGGLEPRSGSSLAQKIRTQVQAAIAGADVIIFLVDIRDGVLPVDEDIAGLLRSCNKPVVLAANKADNAKLENQAAEFYRLGLGVPLAISGQHGRGVNNLVEVVSRHLPAEPQIALPEPDMPKLAIVGRPNVGKSMLLNAIVGEERAIVDETPGTTRDALDTVYNYQGQEVLLIDTAGIRRRGRIGEGIEYYSLIRALNAINRCDVALLVTDATEFLTAQDVHIAGYIKEACKGMVLLVNKWDLVSGNTQPYAECISGRLKFMPYIPVLYVSAKLGHNVEKIIPQALEVWKERQRRLPDKVVDKLFKDAVLAHSPPRKGMKRLRIIRVYQTDVNPPSFTFIVNDPELMHFSYQRYLENRLRQTFGFHGTGLRFVLKRAANKGKEKTGVST